MTNEQLATLVAAAEKAKACLPFPESAEPDPEVGTNLEHSSGTPLGWMTSGDHARFVVTANPSAILSLVARLREAEGALKPFAKTGELFPPLEPGHFDMCVYAPAAGKEYNIAAEDLRRARAALKGQSDE